MEQLNLTVLNVEKYLNEKTSLNINKDEIREILNNNGGRTINVMKQFDSVNNIKLDKYSIEEVDTMKPEDFITDLPNKIIIPKSAFNQIKSSLNCSTPIASRERRKLELMNNIFESINNLEKTLERFKKLS